MSIEAKRGCGYRKIGGLYLVGDGLTLECQHLPVNLGACRACAHSPRFSRNVQRAVPQELFYNLNGTQCAAFCPITELAAQKTEPIVGLAWVGEKFYTPASFTQEALELGVSKRVPVVPTWVELGKTWIFLAHPHAIALMALGQPREFYPGIFYAFRPRRIEKIVTDQTPEEELARLREKGITPVIVPHDDPDHQPKSEILAVPSSRAVMVSRRAISSCTEALPLFASVLKSSSKGVDMNLQEKTLAELAQGATGIATLKVAGFWKKGLVFLNGAERYFGFPLGPDRSSFVIRRFKIVTNGVKVGSEILAIPAAELKALLSGDENG